MGILPKLVNAALVPFEAWIDVWRMFEELSNGDAISNVAMVVGRFAWTLATALVPFLIISLPLGI